MLNIRCVNITVAVLVSLVMTTAQAQQPARSANMTFFVTSVGLGKGGDLGGLEGADRHCQTLAQGVGAGSKTWRAYLSTQPTGGRQAINARERIGTGPWYNAMGVPVGANVGDLHSDNNKLNKATALDENAKVIKGRGDTPVQHDILTGSQHDGTAFAAGDDMTCHNWTSGAEGSAIVGHTDLIGNTRGPNFWNYSHSTPGCSVGDLARVGGAGLLYCFALP